MRSYAVVMLDPPVTTLYNYTMAFLLTCAGCGAKYRYGEGHACSVKPPAISPVPGNGSGPDAALPEKSPRKKLAKIAAELPGAVSIGESVADRGSITPSERTKRWREKNRERYNEYMREYRRRKK